MQASTLPTVSDAGDGRHLAAIVFADLVGYSRLMAADEVGTHARWSAFYDTVVKPEGERHGGRIKDLRGDGVLIEFASVLNAVKWAGPCIRRPPQPALTASRPSSSAWRSIWGRSLSPAKGYSAMR